MGHVNIWIRKENEAWWEEFGSSEFINGCVSLYRDNSLAAIPGEKTTPISEIKLSGVGSPGDWSTGSEEIEIPVPKVKAKRRGFCEHGAEKYRCTQKGCSNGPR